MAMIKAENEIKIVIGSWGSYNACNERALGSKWLTLSEYESWEDIEEALTKQGFDLKGIDEELFIQDIENLELVGVNTDYMNPKRLFQVLYESEVLTDKDKLDILHIFLEVRSFGEFEALVDKYGSHWSDDIQIYKGYDWNDYGIEMYNNAGYTIPDSLIHYFDFEEYGESFEYEGAEKYSGGIIIIG